MNENQDRLMDLALTEAARKNAPPDLSARILAAARGEAPVSRNTGKVHALPKRNIGILPIAITSIAALLVLAVLLNINFIRDIVTRTPNRTATSVNDNRPKNSLAPEEKTKPKPEQEGSGRSNTPAPNPTPDSPNSDSPRNSPEQRKPREGEVEKPTPESKTREPEKKPEPEQPKDSVEQPKDPKPEEKPLEHIEKPKPEGTETANPEPVVAYWRCAITEMDSVKITYPDDGRARPKKDPAGGEYWPVYAGARIKARAMSFRLVSGAVLWMDGELSISLKDEIVGFDVLKDEFFLDNLGTGKPLKVTMGELAVDVREGAAMFSHTTSGLEILCTDGEIVAENKSIQRGFTATLGKRGLSAMREMSKRQWSEPLLQSVPPRIIHAEDFADEPDGGLYGGKIAEGAASTKGDGTFVAFRFNPTLEVMPRMAVRFAVRYSNAKRLQLELFDRSEHKEPWLIHLTPKGGSWVEVTVKFDELRQRDEPNARLKPGDLLRNFKLYVEGEKDASLEVDWVEFVRLGPTE